MMNIKNILLMCLFTTFISLNIDRYGNWCKGNITTPEKACFVLQNMIDTAPNQFAQAKLLKKLYNMKYENFKLSKKNDIM